MTRNIVENIEVSAAGLFMGCTLNKEVTRWELCNCKIEHCADCGGKRIREATRTVEVIIPPLTRNGQVLYVRNEGHQAPEMPPGDVHFTTVCQNDKIYAIDNNDLLLKRSISVPLFDVLANCAEVVLKDLDGSEFVVRFSSHRMYHGIILAVREQGLPMGDGQRGSLFIRVELMQNNFSGFSARAMKEFLQINLEVPLEAEDVNLEYEQ